MHQRLSQTAASQSPADAMTIELLQWVARQPRTYHETMDAWRTGCPRFPVWEDAHSAGLVRVTRAHGTGPGLVELTPQGREMVGAGERRDG